MLRKAYRFDPAVNRESYLAANRYLLQFVTNSRASPHKPMGEIARHRIQDTLRCWLAGLDEAVASSLAGFDQWLATAIAEDECYIERREAHRAALSAARGMSRWMLNADPAVADWRNALINERGDWRSPKAPWTTAAIAEQRLEEFLAFCVQAREFEAGIEEMECRVARADLDLATVARPRELGYALCLHHGRGMFDPDDLFEAGRRVLQARLADTWLNGGHTIRAAMWLKIVYWDRDAIPHGSARLSPLQTVLQAYRNMPDVPVPSFVQLEAT